MHHFTRQMARIGVALALTSSAWVAQAALIDDHVLVGSTNQGAYYEQLGYTDAYSLRLGIGEWPFPYVDLYVDPAEGHSSYAGIVAGPSYLTYIQNVSIVQVQAGDEISAITLSDGSLPLVAQALKSDYSFLSNPLLSATGEDPDIYLGFSYSDNNGLNPSYGWIHLQYTQASGLTLVSSAMTTSDAGIYALTRTTIPAVPEPGTAALACLGLGGIAGLSMARRRQIRQA